jgi:hypothetical protein
MTSVVGTDWIVCFGAERAVEAGRVACPRQRGEAISASACADCRFLIWRRDDRQPSTDCATDTITARGLG